ncbi:MAG: hypothetical protein AABY22_10440 [Nanoarchaeota archaeon]
MKIINLWLICICLIFLSLIINNILWISGSPEYVLYESIGSITHKNTGFVFNGKIYNTKLEYILEERIWTVLTNWRDITTGLIIGSMLFLVVNKLKKK